MQITVRMKHSFTSGLYNVAENLNSKSLSYLTHAVNKRINANMPLPILSNFKPKFRTWLNLIKSIAELF